MKNVFDYGYFINFKKDSLNESRKKINFRDSYNYKKTTVFISHKHDDLEDLKGVIGFLEEKFNVLCYIDSKDPKMPDTTSLETADIIKTRIKTCDKFILLATNNAVESKWCNWELGYGDANKYSKNIALLPMKPKDKFYNGNEYLELYPIIVKRNSGDKYTDGTLIEPGYYIRYQQDGNYYLKSLYDWFNDV